MRIVFACIVLATAVAPALGAVEPEPSLPAARLATPGSALSGPGWRVESPVPVRGYLGQFTLRTPQGVVQAQGRELLAIRIAEIPALARLEEVGRGEVFAGAIANSAKATGRAVTRVFTQPEETIKGIPAGIGRLVKRTAQSVRRVAVAVGDAARREEKQGGAAGESSGDSAGKARDFANELAGVNKARRAIAKAMGIDPYTGNPLLQQRLEDLAWASVAGGLSMDLALGAVGGLAADVLSTTTRLDDLAWDLPPEDIRRRLEKELTDRGAEPMAAREFLRNGAFTPSLQLAFVGALRGLGRPRGEADVLALATEVVRSEVHARFLVQQLRMLARDVGKDDPVAELLAFEASIGARTRGGVLWIALPVDHLSWTEQVEGATTGRDEAQARLVVAGGVSEMARNELQRAGWRVRADAGLVK